MKVSIFGVVLILLLTLASSVSASPPSGFNWNQTWGDEFEGSTIDTSKWKVWNNIRDYAGAGFTPTWYDPANVSIGGGTVKLTVNKGDQKCHGSYCTIWHGGQLESQLNGGRRTFQYGYFEARIRYHMVGCGFWANFWLYSQEGDAQEFDQEVMTCTGEAGTTQRLVMRPCYHYPGRTGNTYGFPSNATYNDQFHTYGILWPPNQPPVFYYDDQPYDTTFFNPTIPASSQRMWLDLRAGVGREPRVGGINPTDSQLPGIAEYDWVRVWQTSDAAPGSPSPTTTSSPAPASIHGDANHDNKVDGVDYIVWFNHYNMNAIGTVKVI